MDTPQLIVYTNSNIRCPYCIRAKKALTEQHYTFVERDIANPVIKAELMERRSNARTVPQIFLSDGTYVGGCDDLLALIPEGLDAMLEMV